MRTKFQTASIGVNFAKTKVVELYVHGGLKLFGSDQVDESNRVS